MKIFFVLPNLECGGAEKMTVQFLNEIDLTKFCPAVVLFKAKGKLLGQLASQIRVIDLGADLLKKNFFTRFFMLVFQIRRTINSENPKMVISILLYPNILVSLAGLLSKRFIHIVSIRSFLAKSIESYRCRPLWFFILKWVFGKADWVFCVAEGIRDELQRVFKTKASKVLTVRNGINISEILALSQEKAEDIPCLFENIPVIVSVGVLKKAKNYRLLLEAFSLLLQKRSCRLLLIGDGPERGALYEKAETLGILGNVIFAGFKKNPHQYVVKASLFVLTSDYEGYHNASMEAHVCGVPVIATEVFREAHGQDNFSSIYYVKHNDPEDLARGMMTVLENNNLRKNLIQNGRLWADQNNLEHYVTDLEGLLNNISEKNQAGR